MKRTKFQQCSVLVVSFRLIIERVKRAANSREMKLAFIIEATKTLNSRRATV